MSEFPALHNSAIPLDIFFFLLCIPLDPFVFQIFHEILCSSCYPFHWIPSSFMYSMRFCVLFCYPFHWITSSFCYSMRSFILLARHSIEFPLCLLFHSSLLLFRSRAQQSILFLSPTYLPCTRHLQYLLSHASVNIYFYKIDAVVCSIAFAICAELCRCIYLYL